MAPEIVRLSFGKRPSRRHYENRSTGCAPEDGTERSASVLIRPTPDVTLIEITAAASLALPDLESNRAEHDDQPRHALADVKHSLAYGFRACVGNRALHLGPPGSGPYPNHRFHSPARGAAGGARARRCAKSDPTGPAAATCGWAFAVLTM
jgi:hypothetical protein